MSPVDDWASLCLLRLMRRAMADQESADAGDEEGEASREPWRQRLHGVVVGEDLLLRADLCVVRRLLAWVDIQMGR